MFWQLVNILFPLFCLVGVGFIYAKKYHPDLASANQLNLLVLLPCLIVSVLVDKDLQLSNYLNLALAASAVVIGSGLLAYPLARLLGFNAKTFVPPLMFNNSGNLGLPLLVLAFGEQALAPAVILFLVENSLHFSLGMKILNPSYPLWHITKIPMLVATVIGIAINYANLEIPATILKPVDMLGQIAIPLMLVALGVRLASNKISDIKIGLSAAILCPLTGLISLLIITIFIQLPLLQWQLLVIFSLLPPAVLNYMVAEKFNQEPHKVASMVMLGNLLALAVLPLALWYLLSF